LSLDYLKSEIKTSDLNQALATITIDYEHYWLLLLLLLVLILIVIVILILVLHLGPAVTFKVTLTISIVMDFKALVIISSYYYNGFGELCKIMNFVNTVKCCNYH